MTVKPVWMAFLLGAALAACQKDTAGVKSSPPPLAGLRYFDAVADTGYLDFRVIDIVQYAPNSIRARFRTGGDPGGVSNSTFSPPYLPVQAGTRHIRVFLDSTDLATATKVIFDTSVTFEAGANYTFYLYGYARTGSTPAVSALVTKDVVPTIPAGNIAVRVINLDPSQATGSDAFVAAKDTTGSFTGTPTVGSQAFKGVSNYVNVPVGSYRGGFAATSTTTPILFMANMPGGVVGTSSVNPIAGTLVAGSGFTMLVLPRSVAGSAAPQTPGGLTIASLTLAGSTATALVSGGHGLATNDIIRVRGATQTQYNGAFTVRKLTDSTFTYQVYGAPVSPATGTIKFVPILNDFANPYVFFLTDQQPALTAP